jgi:NAD(P)-dependent dehydrogenase (short-subunit alcohol dehydrogenase family)
MTQNSNQAVLITGANGGIGRSLCKLFSDKGYFVIATDIDAVSNCLSYVYISLDLSELATSEDVEKKFINDFEGRIQKKKLIALINNAAYQKLANISNVLLSDFRKTLDINVTAPFLLSKLLFPYLKKSKGSIVNIGSIHSKLTKPEFISYATSKSALLGLTQSLAVDLAPEVRVNIIQPAATRTEMLINGFDGDEKMLDKLKSYHPLKRIAEPDEIARAALFLVSQECQFISGAKLDIDGGIGCRLHDPNFDF